MKSLAAALVVLSGTLLWAVAAVCETWAYASGGNRGAAELAAFGGIAIATIGLLFLVRAFKLP